MAWQAIGLQCKLWTLLPSLSAEMKTKRFGFQMIRILQPLDEKHLQEIYIQCNAVGTEEDWTVLLFTSVSAFETE